MGQAKSQNIGETSADRTTDSKQKLLQAVHSLDEDTLLHILSYVDIKTLINLRLVCHWWKHLIDNEVWRLKVSREKYRSLKSVELNHKLPWFVYYCICASDPFGRNLLKNHCGQEQFEFWDILTNGGDKWLVEDPPIGTNAVPQGEEFDNLSSCFATSYDSCSKEQIVDLLSVGVNGKIMDEFQPLIEVSEWYAGRVDCGCEYEMECTLLNERKEPVCKFKCPESVKRWKGSTWHKVSHVFENYGTGVRFIKFYHGGKDTQYWAGHFGSKMSGACVKLMILLPAS